jgi:hypothetical protein
VVSDTGDSRQVEEVIASDARLSVAELDALGEPRYDFYDPITDERRSGLTQAQAFAIAAQA